MFDHHKTVDLRLSHPDSRHHRHISNAEGCNGLCDTGSCWAHRYGGPLGSNKKRKLEFSPPVQNQSTGLIFLTFGGRLKVTETQTPCFFEPVQLLSSDQSLQSLSPSQSHASRMQTPLAQVNSPGPHW